MNSQTYKEKFGVSKTTFKNMKKQGLLPLKDGTMKDALVIFKKLRSARKLKITKLQQRKHEDSTLYRRTKGKPRKRKDGKIQGSVKPGSRIGKINIK